MSNKLDTARWLNAKNIYGTCGKWAYSHWGEAKEDSHYCELRESPKCTGGNVTSHQEWSWIMKEVMLIGRNSHYYVRKGKLSEDFESAFERALDKSVESIARTMGLESQVLFF